MSSQLNLAHIEASTCSGCRFAKPMPYEGRDTSGRMRVMGSILRYCEAAGADLYCDRCCRVVSADPCPWCGKVAIVVPKKYTLEHGPACPAFKP